MKRIAILLAALVAAGTSVIAAATSIIPANTVRNAVELQIRAATGLDALLRGPVSVSMFPAPAVVFSDVALHQRAAGETALAAESLTVNLRLMPLLAGRVALAVRVAEACGMTLLAIARGDDFEMFSHPERITASVGARRTAVSSAALSA